MVLLLLGILLGIAVPRMFSGERFAAHGYADQLLAGLRFARSLAIAQRTPVYVVVTSSEARFCFDLACATPAIGPDGSRPFRLRAPASVALGYAGSFSFDALGAPDFATALQLPVTGDVTRVLTVEAETGYAH